MTKLKIKRGSRSYLPIPVTTLASGLELCVPVHVVAGESTGPTVGLTAVTHGDATAGAKWIKMVLEALDPASMKGTVICVPVGNPIGFEWNSRHTPIDSVNMNRVYPGNAVGRVTDQMAHILADLVLQCDVHIDCHGGGPDSINYMYAKPSGGSNPEYDSRTFELARAFGMEYLWRGGFYKGSLTDYAYLNGILGLLLELGPPEPLGQRYYDEAVLGTLNMLRHLDMLPGKPQSVRKTQWLLSERKLLRPRHGGLFIPEVRHDKLNAVLPKDTVLARVLDPGSLEEIDIITAPYDETVVLALRHEVTRVHPGSYAYILANRSNAERYDN